MSCSNNTSSCSTNFKASVTETFVKNIFWTDVNNTPIDLTGYTVVFTINGNPVSTTVTPTAGEISITLSPAQVAALGLGRHSYRLNVTSAGGISTDLLTGIILVF